MADFGSVEHVHPMELRHSPDCYYFYHNYHSPNFVYSKEKERHDTTAASKKHQIKTSFLSILFSSGMSTPLRPFRGLRTRSNDQPTPICKVPASLSLHDCAFLLCPNLYGMLGVC